MKCPDYRIGNRDTWELWSILLVVLDFGQHISYLGNCHPFKSFGFYASVIEEIVEAVHKIFGKTVYFLVEAGFRFLCIGCQSVMRIILANAILNLFFQ